MNEHNHEISKMTRRRILSVAPRAIALAPLGLFTGQREALAQVGAQPGWRFCGKCYVLFYDGAPDKGHCPLGGAHLAHGFLFSLHYDGNPALSPRMQYAWRHCEKCRTLFFDGYPTKGHCPAGGGHVAQGLMFGLDFQPPPAKHQTNWRFCSKCESLFFDGFPGKGSCPAGGGHTAQGYMFNLLYRDVIDDVGTAISNELPRAIAANRSVLERRIKEELGRGDLIRKGVTLYNINFRLGGPSFQFNNGRFDYRMIDNYMYFKSTTPTIFGSYGDPAFELHFDSVLMGSVITPPGGKPRVDNVVARVPRISVSPRNVSGGVVTTVVRFFQLTEPGARIIQQAHNNFNSDLTRSVNDYLARL